MTRFMITEKAWNTLQKALIDVGCYVTDNIRCAIEGMLWHLRTGTPWRDLSPEFGAWNTIYRLYSRWCHNGVIEQLLELVEGKIDYRTAYVDGTYVRVHQHASGAAKGKEAAIGPSRGGITTKIHAACDRQGKPVVTEITAGNVSDIAHAETMIDELVPIFDEVVADKGYDSDSFRSDILEAGSTPVIPTKSNSSRENPGFHKTKYKNRHRIENLFARLKHFRGIATRYDKLKIIFENALKLAQIAIWLDLKVGG